MWTTQNDISILAVIVHWIDNNWNYCEQVLEFSEIVGSHSGKNIATQFVDCLNECQLKDKVCITSTFIILFNSFYSLCVLLVTMLVII
jgi:hypothetical protein